MNEEKNSVLYEMFCSMPDNIGDKKYCTPWKQKVLTYDFQNYSSLVKEKH